MTVFYVSPNGSDSQNGTAGQPFGSLQHAHDAAQPGDEIQLRGGTYHLTQGIQLTSDGTSAQPITVTNYPGEVPVLDGSAVTTTGQGGYVLDLSGVAYNHISGLQITGGAEGGVMIGNDSHDNVIEGLDVSHNGRLSEYEGKGFSLYDNSANNLLLNNDSHDNRDLHGDNADGFQISTTGTGNVLRGNRAYNNSDDGFDLFNIQNGTTSAPVTLDGNWAWGNGMIDGQATGGDGNGFKLGGARPGTGTQSGGHTLTNNVAWDNVASGFDENEATIPLTLSNNTAYDNGTYNFGFYTQQNTLKDNLSLGSGEVSASGSSSNNSWDLANPPTTASVQSLDASVAEGARAADGSLPASGFLQMNGSGSAALGAAAPEATSAPAAVQSAGTAALTQAPADAAGTGGSAPATAAAGTATTATGASVPAAGATADVTATEVTASGSTPTDGAASGGTATNVAASGSAPTTAAAGGAPASDLVAGAPASAASTSVPAAGQTIGDAIDPVTLVTGDPNGYAGSANATSTDLVQGSGSGSRHGHGGWNAFADAGNHGHGMALSDHGGTASTDPLQLLSGGACDGRFSFADSRAA